MQLNTHQTGFTLIEALVAIAIAAIILGIAVPNFQDFMRNTRLTTQANDFVLALAFAKSEAVKRNRDVVVCSSSNATSCANSTNWHIGWIVHSDTDDDGTVDTDEILQVRGALEGNNTLTTGTLTAATFANTGFSIGSSATFTLCTTGITTGRQISLSQQGRASVTSISCP
jgi:type IV fimbrial biogenesis protein FimT